jgi:Tol biopolymer transport system component
MLKSAVFLKDFPLRSMFNWKSMQSEGRKTMHRFHFLLWLLFLGCTCVTSQGATKKSLGKIAYSSQNMLFIMNADGSHRTSLGTAAWQPSFSSDGQQIVFVDPANELRIYVINADGTGKVCLTPKDTENFTPSFSPDGRKVLFRSSTDEICTVNIDGTGLTKLTSVGRCPHFSSDGRKIVTAQGSIILMNADGSEPVELIKGVGAVIPCFSPDGTKIAFSTTGGAGDSIFIMNVDGSGLRCVTKNPRGKSIPSQYGDSGLCFSPDGKQISFTSTRNDTRQLFTICVDGTGEKMLIGGKGNFGPTWTRGSVLKPSRVVPLH